MHGVDLDIFVRFDRQMAKKPKKVIPPDEPVDEAETKRFREKALYKALDLLGPFPWKQSRRVTYSFDISSGRWGFDRESADEFCEGIIHSYSGRVSAENSSGRPQTLLTHLRDLAGDINRLIQKLNKLTQEERQFINDELWLDRSRSAIIPRSESEQKLRMQPSWSEIKRPQELVDFLPSYASRQDGPVKGRLLEQLQILTNYLSVKVKAAERDFRFASKKDQGGKSSVYRLVRIPPIWHLVHESWTLFLESGHLQATTTDGGVFLEFIRALHESATGKEVGASKLEFTVRQYAKVRSAHQKVRNRLISILKKKGIKSKDDIEDAWDRDYLEMKFDGDKSLGLILSLFDEHLKTRLMIDFGPTLAALSENKTN